MGDFDYVKVVLERLAGAAFTWSQVAIKPAKPLAFGVVQGIPVFGLPGNPVSSRVSFELFARPALRKMMGRTAPIATPVRATARTAFSRRPDGKLHLDRVRVTVRTVATCASGPGSRRATCSPAWRPPTVWPSSPTATGSRPGSRRGTPARSVAESGGAICFLQARAVERGRIKTVGVTVEHTGPPSPQSAGTHRFGERPNLGV